jgi:branched-chain amino acid transport system substrate-binding protein
MPICRHRLLNAIEQAGSTDYDAVTNALRTNDVETPLGKHPFDDRGDAIGVGFPCTRSKMVLTSN